MTGIKPTSSRESPQIHHESLSSWLATEGGDRAGIHQSRLLNILLLILALTTLLYLGILILWPAYRPALPVLLGLLLALVGLRYLNQRGRTQLAAQLLVGLLTGVLFLSPLLTGTGLSLILVHGYFFVILLAGLLLGWKAGIGAMLLTLLSGTTLTLLEQAGMLADVVPSLSPIDRWLQFAPSLLLLVAVMIATGRWLRSVLHHVQANSAALREANALLQTQSDELATYQQELTLLLEDRSMALDGVTAQALIFMALADNSPIAIGIADLDQHINYANPAFYEIFGYDERQQEIIGLPTDALWPAETAAQHAEIERQATEGGWTGDIQMRRKDGSLFDVGISTFSVSDMTGEVCGQALLARDISYRKRAEQELRQALEQEQRLGELRSRFISMVSHEFRTPLAIIQSSADTLEHYHDRLEPARRAQRYERIYTQVGHMTVMLDEIMTIGKLEARLIEFNPVPVDVVKLCQNLVDEVRLLGQPNPIELRLDDASCAPIDLDEKLMRQIMSNLLSNAIKYSPDGQPIEVSLICADPHVLRLSVSDHGIGIPMVDQDNLFEAFHRASNVGAIAGTGLGLAIVQRAVNLQGGTITCTSTEGAGTTFTITLPRQTDPTG